MSIKNKRERSKNFLEEEKEELLLLVQDYKNLIENRRTDAVTSSEKIKAWAQIAEKFNANAKTGLRTPAQLKLLYEGMKKNAKKRKADDKAEAYKTGGGNYMPSVTNTDAKVIAFLGPQITSLNNIHDSNNDMHVSKEIPDSVYEEEYLDEELLNAFPVQDEYFYLPGTSRNSPSLPSINTDITVPVTSSVPATTSVPTTTSAPTTTSVPATNIKNRFLDRIKKKQFNKNKKRNTKDVSEEILRMKLERHNKKMEILEIIRKKEEIDLKLKEIELSKALKEK